MPHLTLEYSSNLDPDPDFATLFSRFHEILAAAGIKKENCKSRAVSRARFFIGTGGSGRAFVHLDARILQGRAPETKRAIGGQLLAALRDHFRAPENVDDLQLTVEIRDMARHSYFKFPPGTLDYGSSTTAAG
jgi:5-carboxymethyl-2-hydroxymuconate isomerase